MSHRDFRDSKQKAKHVLNGSKSMVMVSQSVQPVKKPLVHNKTAKSAVPFCLEMSDKNCSLNDAKYFTYKALPRNRRPFALKDFALIREIFKIADSFARLESTEVRLTDVLRAYDTVLQRHGLDPTEDTFYYRMLLKLSLRPEHDWWNKLNKEILKNDLLLKANGFHSHKILLFYWLQWRCFHKRCFRRVKSQVARISFYNDLNPEPVQCRDSLKLAIAVPHQQTFTQLPSSRNERLYEKELTELPVLESKHSQKASKSAHTSLMAHSFSLWQRLSFQLKNSKEKKQRKAQEWNRAATYYNKHVLLKTLQQWHQHYCDLRNGAALLHTKRLLILFMEKWKELVALNIKLCEAGDEYNRRRLLLSSFSTWKNYMKMLNELRVNALKAQLLRSWKRNTISSSEMKRNFMKVAVHRSLSLTSKYLIVWHTRYSTKVHLQTVLAKMQAIRKRFTLTGWHLIAQAKAYRNANIIISLRRWSQRIQHTILHNWKSLVCYSIHMQHVKTRIYTWRKAFLQKKAFKFWSIWCQGQQALRKCCQFHTLVNLKKAFTAWKEWVSYQKFKRATAVSSIRHFFFWHCKRALLRWKDWKDESIERKQSSVVLKDFQKEKMKVQYWQHWFQEFNNEIVVSQFCSLREEKSAKLLIRILSDHTVESQEKREKIRASYYYWQLKVLKDAFCRWRKNCAGYKNCMPVSVPVAEPFRNVEYLEMARDVLHALLSHCQQESKVEFCRHKVRHNLAHGFLKRWKKLTVSRQSENLLVYQLSQGLKTLPEDSNVASVLLSSWTSNSTYAVFEIWRHWYKTRIYHKKKNLAALSQLSGVLLFKAVMSLRIASGYARRRKLLKLISRSGIQVRTLLHMKYICNQQRRLANLNVHAMLHFERKLYESVWNTWRKYINDVKSMSFACEKAYVYNRVLYLRKAFLGWFHVLKENRVKLKQLTGIKIRIEYSFLHSAFHLWHSLTQQRKLQKRNVVVLLNHHRRTQLFRSFHFWLSFTHNKKCLRVATEIHRRSLLKCFFTTWTSYAVRSKRKKGAQELVTKRVFLRFGRTAFLGWQDITRMANHIRRKQALAFSKLRYSQLVHAFARWRIVVSNSMFLKHMFTYFRLQRKRRLYSKWFEVTRQQKMLRASRIGVSSCKKQHLTQQTLREWKDLTSKYLFSKQQEEKAQEFRRRHILARVGKGLKDWRNKQQNKQKLFLEARERLTRIHTRLMFNAWSMQAYISSEEKITMSQLQRMHEQRLLSRTLHSLHELAEANWHLKKQVMQALGEHLEGRRNARAAFWHRQRLTVYVSKGWHAHSVLMRTLRQREWNFKMKVLKRVLKKWRLAFQHRKNLRSLASHLASYHTLIVLKHYWPRWQTRTQTSRYQSQCLVFRCFKKWIDYSQQAAFWRCKQKHVTFIILQSLEKRVIWAWHGLVCEIAVRREEHYQQRLIQREALGMATRTERRQKTELLHGIFATWKLKLQLTKKLHEVVKKRTTKRKRRGWSTWRVLVGLSCKYRQLRTTWIVSTSKTTLSMWRHATWLRIHKRQQYELEAVKVAERKCMKKAWVQWKVLLRFNHERARVLKECFRLIQARQCWQTIHDILSAWEDYAIQRNKRRERFWQAEATHKRHKMTDYFSAWRHYTAASIDSAAKLRGSIQLYQRRINASDLQNAELHPELRPSTRHYRQSMSALQRHHSQQQQVIIQEVKQSESGDITEGNNSGVVIHKVSPREVNSEHGGESIKSEESKEETVTLNVASRHMSVERGVYDGVVATEGWPYELPNGGVAWIRCMVEQCTPIQQHRRGDF